MTPGWSGSFLHSSTRTTNAAGRVAKTSGVSPGVSISSCCRSINSLSSTMQTVHFKVRCTSTFSLQHTYILISGLCTDYPIGIRQALQRGWQAPSRQVGSQQAGCPRSLPGSQLQGANGTPRHAPIAHCSRVFFLEGLLPTGQETVPAGMQEGAFSGGLCWLSSCLKDHPCAPEVNGIQRKREKKQERMGERKR